MIKKEIAKAQNSKFSPKTMEELLASLSGKTLFLSRGQEVEGEVVALTDQEIILDLGVKSEGILNKKELPSAGKEVKVGDKIKAYVDTGSDSGQVSLTTQKQLPRSSFSGNRRNISWDKFIQAQRQRSKLTGTVTELNKGGLIVEIDGTRGFLPSSQLGFQTIELTKEGKELVGQNLTVEVIEIDSDNNRLIFSQKGEAPEKAVKALESFAAGQKVKGEVTAVLPFALFIKSGESLGIVYNTDLSWEKNDNPGSLFKFGQTVEAVVINIDTQLGRLSLSLKALEEDPFTKVVEQYPVDEVVKGVVKSVSDAGVAVDLKGGAEGFVAASLLEGNIYQPGQETNFLVDSVDKSKRKINLAPFLTSTKGLIYK